MNQLLLFGSLVFTLPCGECHPKKINNPLQEFVPGTYAKYVEGEFSKAWDTLHFAVYDVNKNIYRVTRRTGFQRILEGKIQPREYEQKRMMAVFDPSSGQLQDRKSGKLFTFSEENNTVLWVSSEYTKVE